jgi:hypothetical protein
MEENRIPKRVFYMNLETRLTGRPRNRWQDEVRKDGSIVGGEGWQEKVYNRKEWKLLRMVRNRHILHMPTELMNECTYACKHNGGNNNFITACFYQSSNLSIHVHFSEFLFSSR